MVRRSLISIFVVLFIASALFAQSGSPLSLEKIMAGDQWIGYQPSNPRWSADGLKIYFQWNPENYPSDSLYIYNVRSGSIRKMTPAERRELPPDRVGYDENRRRMVFTRNGDLFIKDIRRSESRQLTNTVENISGPSFTRDGDKITYISENNMYLFNLEKGSVRQLTDFRQRSAPSEKVHGRQDQWLKDQQTDLFEVLRERKELEELRQEHREADSPERPLSIYTGNASAGNLRLNPGERFISYFLYAPADAEFTMMPDYVTLSGYTEERTTRPKVGADQMSVTAGIYDLEQKKSYMVETGDLPGIRDVPEYMREYGFDADELEHDREVVFTALLWSPEGDKAVVNIRARDNKDRWIMLLDPETGQLSLLDRQRDEAWIAGPGINVPPSGQGMGWMPDNRRIWFQSEESGWSHLYTVDVATAEITALTSGEFEVYGPQLSHDNKYWYFTSNEVHPGERHFYMMPAEGGSRTRVTGMEGRNDVIVSPDGKKLAIRHSFYNKPWELYVMDNKPMAEPVQVTHSLSDEFREYDWRIPELLTFEAIDGAEVWARLYRPEDPEPDGPAVIFVHGAGYLQNAHKWWSSYLREYMFHNLLVDKGYTVLDIDFRASAGYGRDWRTGIYRHMGGKDLSDNVDGARFLVENYDIDPSRIGIYGGSYGGFITLMAMFDHPDIFAAGAALRSVTDWAHYNHGYTSNILNTPVCDSLAFVRSSPIYFAEGLEGALLMCHGMIDDNVHFQDIVRLTQRLIELGKENWELAVYPVERHAFIETSSWVDEYRRILKLFEDNLK